MRRSRPRSPERLTTVQTPRIGPKQLILRATQRVGGEPGADAIDRPPVHRMPAPRRQEDSQALRDQPQASERERPMGLLGLEAACPKRSTSRPAPGRKIHPYLLRRLQIVRPDQVWASDITHIPTQHGFLYLTAVMHLFSRNVLSWKLSNTLTGRRPPPAAPDVASRVPRPILDLPPIKQKRMAAVYRATSL